jgi:hypothetical protein
MFVDAMNSTPELSIKMLQTPEQWDSIYQNYKLQEEVANVTHHFKRRRMIIPFFHQTIISVPNHQKFSRILMISVLDAPSLFSHSSGDDRRY